MPNNRIFVVRARQEFKSRSDKEGKDAVAGETPEKTIELTEDFCEDTNSFPSESPYQKSRFFRDLTPILIPGKIFGIFFKRHKVKGKWVMEKWVWYCVFIALFQLLSLARSLAVFSSQEDFTSDTLFFKIKLAIWGTENTVKLFAMLHASFRKRCFPEFFQTWITVCEDRPLRGHLLVVQRLALILASNFVIVNTLGIIGSMLYVPELHDFYLKLSWPGADSDSNGYLYKWVFMVCAFVGSGIGMYSVGLLVVLSFAVTDEFYDVAKRFSTYINKDGTFDGDLEKLRRRHQGLCKLTDILDDSFMVLIAVVYMANVPMSCVILYNAIYLTHSLALNIFNAFWMFSLIIHLVVVSFVCARLNVAAHKPLEEVYNICADSLKDQQVQLMMFMNRLVGSEVGLTAIKMFVINRPTILTVVGMLITYFVLLVQFKTPAVAICDCGNVTVT